MAATTGVFNSTDVKLYIDGVAVACLVDATVSLTRDFRDATCKDSGIWRDILPSRLSGNISGSLLYKDTDATNGIWDIYDDFVAGTSVTALWAKDNAGDTFLSASAYVATWEVGSPGSQENVTGNFTLELTGTLTKGTLVSIS